MRDPIIVDISTMRHLVYGGRICGSGEDDPGNLFASSFLRKEKITITHCRISKCAAGRESRIGDPDSSDTRKLEVSKFSVIKSGSNLGRGGGGGNSAVLITFWCSGKKGVTGRKTAMTQMTPNSRV